MKALLALIIIVSCVWCGYSIYTIGDQPDRKEKDGDTLV
jgi:hypothetical protein